MEPEKLPPLWALDMAAKDVRFEDWADVNSNWRGTKTHMAVTAYARTLAKYEKPPVDEAELKRRQDARELAVVSNPMWGEATAQRTLNGHADCLSVSGVYKWLCQRDGTQPIPVEEWSK